MEYEPVIGLEVHLQSKTKSKMFCSCSTDYFGKEPNTYTCPVCLGLPGAMPVPNKHAIDLCIKMALGLNCKVPLETKFDRKNYFYPDLPKGYQISQYDQPIGIDGYVELDINGDKKKIGITRVHQEEDTGKSIHKGDVTLLDFNKSGMPLIEIVSEPDFRSVEEVTGYAKLLHQTARYLGISDADMEKGQMRFEINISLRKRGSNGLPDYKVEVKNIGSISVLRKVIESEIERQSEILESGKTPVQETRGLSDMSGKTFSQRTKETSDDYRYFPEPDIPPIEFTKEYIEKLRSELSEGPQEKERRYIKNYGLSKYIAPVLVSNIYKSSLFEQVVSEVENRIEDEKEYEESKNTLLQTVADFVNDLSMSVVKDSISTEKIAGNIFDCVKMYHYDRLSYSNAKKVLYNSIKEKKDPSVLVKERNLLGKTTSSELEIICKKVINENPKVVADYKKNPNAVQFLIGLVMKETKGKADVNEILFWLTEMLTH